MDCDEEELEKTRKINQSKCEYCKEIEKNNTKINGKKFEMKETAGFLKDRFYESWILKCKNDKNASILILTNGTNGVYFDINYCPICGRKL